MGSHADLVISSTRIVTPQGVSPGSITIRDGLITGVDPPGAAPLARDHFDAGDSVVLPGLVDTHVHINDPGRADWEGFDTATKAAAAGGVTMLVDMPLNSSPVTTTVPALQQKADAAAGRCMVDYGFWGGIVSRDTSQLAPLFHAGVLGFKCFLVHSGIDDFPSVSESDLRSVMPGLARLGAVLLAHAEAPGPIERASAIPPHSPDGRHYADYLASRPRAAEQESIEMLIRLCKDTKCRVHIVHLASADALDALRAARAESLPITVETCPHYLTFAAENIFDGATLLKCAPPIRERENRERLWGGLRDRIIDLVATDHSPCPPEMKQLATGDFRAAWGGISSLQLSLPVMWTEASRRGYELTDLAAWMCERPARLAGLHDRKGRIAPGYHADLVIFRPEEQFVVDPARLHHRHKATPYAGLTLHGVVDRTFVRGACVFHDGALPAAPAGQWLTRSSA